MTTQPSSMVVCLWCEHCPVTACPADRFERNTCRPAPTNLPCDSPLVCLPFPGTASTSGPKLAWRIIPSRRSFPPSTHQLEPRVPFISPSDIPSPPRASTCGNSLKLLLLPIMVVRHRLLSGTPFGQRVRLPRSMNRTVKKQRRET